jgi:transposase
MGQGGKKQKTDKRDAGELCDCLDRYLRGQDKALSVVAVPTEEQEEKRALIRYHRQIMADRGRCEARGKGLLCAQGIEVHGRWWHGGAWLEVQSDPRLRTG